MLALLRVRKQTEEHVKGMTCKAISEPKQKEKCWAYQAVSVEIENVNNSPIIHQPYSLHFMDSYT